MNDYPSCLETRATLRIYSKTVSPIEITRRLGIEPTHSQNIGEPLHKDKIKINGWFLSSKGHVKSHDSRKHVDWIFKRIGNKTKVLKYLQKNKCRMDISCYWLSRSGNGGPTISPKQSYLLSKANIDLGYDFYAVEVLEKILQNVLAERKISKKIKRLQKIALNKG